MAATHLLAAIPRTDAFDFDTKIDTGHNPARR
jgi:hypothetical protein